MGKKHLVIPVNVRQPQSQGMNIHQSQLDTEIHILYLGFPASEIDVHRFLTNPDSREEALLRAHYFLTSLFIEAAITVRELRGTGTFSDDDLPDRFRIYMTDGQKRRAHNAKRKNFYANAVERANEVRRPLVIVQHNSQCFTDA
jgi:hypothetical protein